MAIRLTTSQFQKLLADGKVKSFTEKTPVKRKAVKTPPVEPVGLRYIKRVLTAAGIPYTEEYRFHPVRRFRFDIAIPDKLLAIEYEGVFSEKSRHTTAKGYTTDADKYNLAQSMGWRVYRYTAMNYKNIDLDIQGIM